MTLPRDVSSPREVAARLDAGVQVLRVDVPGPVAIVPPEFPYATGPTAYGRFDIGDLVIPAYAYVLSYQLTFEYRSTDPENETAKSSLILASFLGDDSPDEGGAILDLEFTGQAETADWTSAYHADSDQYGYGEQAVYLYGAPYDDSGEGSEFRNISGWFAYVSA